MVVFHSILAHDMDVQYLIFMGRNLENKKKLMPLQIMNIAGMKSKNIANSVNIFSDNVVMTSTFNE